MSSGDTTEQRIMHSKSNNIQIRINYKADEVTEKSFESLLSRYQISLEESGKASDFMFDYVHLIHFRFHIINSILCGSYIDSLNWIKYKKSCNESHQ